MADIKIVVPFGALGACPGDSHLDKMLRLIAVSVDEDPKANWAEKYGTNFENETFMMHRYCWCEEDDCPWCGGCTCGDDVACEYYMDGIQIESSEWLRLRKIEFQALSNDDDYSLVHKRFTHILVNPCEFCRGEKYFAEHGGEPGSGAPNFWYKPENIKIWWYKYIGRGTRLFYYGKMYNDADDFMEKAIVEKIIAECLESL